MLMILRRWTQNMSPGNWKGVVGQDTVILCKVLGCNWVLCAIANWPTERGDARRFPEAAFRVFDIQTAREAPGRPPKTGRSSKCGCLSGFGSYCVRA